MGLEGWQSLVWLDVFVQCVFVFVFIFVFVKYAPESNVFGGWAHSGVTGDTAIERYLGVNKAVLDNCPLLQSVFAAEYFTVKCFCMYLYCNIYL